MNIRMHIDRIVLDGVDIAPHQRHVLQAAVATELSRLLTESGIPAGFQHAGNPALILAPPLHLKSSPDAMVLGAQVGAGVYSAITGLDR